MKILLVRPPRIKQSVTLGELMFCEPIGLEMVYNVLKESNEVRILDLMIKGEDLIQECKRFQPEVVGITSLCIDVNLVKELAGRVKEYDNSILTLAGGTQAFFNPSAFFCPDIDHVFKYTTRRNLHELFSAIQTKKEVPFIDGVYSKVNDFKSTDVFGRNEYILPDRASTERYRRFYSYLGYKPCAIMETSLGCSKHCDFCLRWRLEGETESPVDFDCIFEQIMAIKEHNIMFYDNDFLNNKERLQQFCSLIESNRIHKNFISYASVDSILLNQDILGKLAECGLRAVLVGYETFSQKELDQYKKRPTVLDSYKASRLLKEAGIDCWASFIMNPDWDSADFKEFRRFIKKLDPEISTFSPLTPFPNLPMHNQYKDRILVNIEDYESWSFGKVTIQPSKMSLRHYYYEMLKTILYINLRMNSGSYMVKRFGIATLFRISKGSFKALWTYMKLMLAQGSTSTKAKLQ